MGDRLPAGFVRLRKAVAHADASFCRPFPLDPRFVRRRRRGRRRQHAATRQQLTAQLHLGTDCKHRRKHHQRLSGHRKRSRRRCADIQHRRRRRCGGFLDYVRGCTPVQHRAELFRADRCRSQQCLQRPTPRQRRPRECDADGQHHRDQQRRRNLGRARGARRLDQLQPARLSCADPRRQQQRLCRGEWWRGLSVQSDDRQQHARPQHHRSFVWRRTRTAGARRQSKQCEPVDGRRHRTRRLVAGPPLHAGHRVA